MTDNERLARWQGWKCISGDWVAPSGRCENLGMTPNYLNDDAAAMSLLDTLVEKGFEYNLCCNTRSVDFRIYQDDAGFSISIKPTRRAAVVAAVLELIGKEDV